MDKNYNYQADIDALDDVINAFHAGLPTTKFFRKNTITDEEIEADQILNNCPAHSVLFLYQERQGGR